MDGVGPGALGSLRDMEMAVWNRPMALLLLHASAPASPETGNHLARESVATVIRRSSDWTNACLASERCRDLPGLGILALRSGGIRDSGRRSIVNVPELAIRGLELSPACTFGRHDDVGCDAKDPLDTVGICPTVALDEDHPAIWRNGVRLGVLELRPGNRQLHELQKHVLVVLNGGQPSVVPFGCSTEGAPSATSCLADWTRSQTLVRPRDRCLGVRAKTVLHFMSIVSRTRVIDRRNERV